MSRFCTCTCLLAAHTYSLNQVFHVRLRSNHGCMYTQAHTELLKMVVDKSGFGNAKEHARRDMERWVSWFDRINEFLREDQGKGPDEEPEVKIHSPELIAWPSPHVSTDGWALLIKTPQHPSPSTTYYCRNNVPRLWFPCLPLFTTAPNRGALTRLGSKKQKSPTGSITTWRHSMNCFKESKPTVNLCVRQWISRRPVREM